MRTRVVLVACLAVVLAAALLGLPATRHRFLTFSDVVWRSVFSDGVPDHPELVMARQAAPPLPTLVDKPVHVDAEGFFAWALLDRKTGTITGSPNTTATNSTESMIKAWIASDFLRIMTSKNQQPTQSDLALLRRMIRNSDDQAAQTIYERDGGNQSIQRLISTCQLKNTTIYPYWWSRTQISAPDAVRMGACIADGRAAGPKWTQWVLNEMRNVEGAITDQPNGGRWGIIDGLPSELAAQVSIKNGWTAISADNSWHVNCLAIGPDFVLAVLNRYPVSLGLPYGAQHCAAVASQLVEVR